MDESVSTILGGAESGSFNKTTYGTDGADRISAGSENDLIVAGGGADVVRAGGGDDTVVYVVAENSGVRDWYHGGEGQDTLRLELTAAEWQDAAIQADVQAFTEHLESSDGAFRFRAFDLRVNRFEALEVVVDGVIIDPTASLEKADPVSPDLLLNGVSLAAEELAPATVATAMAALGPLVVTTADDIVADDGLLSLREAIAMANGNAGADTITFDAGVFTGGSASVIRLTSGELEITDAVTINGATGTDVIITGDALGNDLTGDSAFITDLDDEAPRFGPALQSEEFLGDNSRIFNITDTSATTRLEGLTLTGGRVEGSTAEGGAIKTVANLTIVDGVLSGNSISNVGVAATSLAGGAIHTTGASLLIVDSVLSGNEA